MELEMEMEMMLCRRMTSKCCGRCWVWGSRRFPGSVSRSEDGWERGMGESVR